MEKIKTEVHKLIEYGFIREEQHPDWVPNIVSVLKKNEKIRVCIDFCGLNTTCPKDEFLLPITDVMINPRNLLLDTPKNDLVGFIFSWWARMIRT